MALAHARPGEVIDVRPLGARLAQTVTHALIKTRSLELMRIVLQAGQSLPPHDVDDEVTIQCLEGRVSVPAAVAQLELAAGELVLLPARDLHGVVALEDSSLLVTVCLPAAHPEDPEPGG